MNEWEWQLLEAKKPVEDLRIGGVEVKPGSRVLLRPKPRGDIMDIALTGKMAVIEAVEQDYEGKIHVCVVIDDDPGRDLGLMRQPGHRFFFDAEEIEPLRSETLEEAPSIDHFSSLSLSSSPAKATPRILIAGIGNIFLGDDAFGVEVVRRLAGHEWPKGSNIRVTDFGIRGYDLAYALLDSYDVTVLVDACPRGDPAGTLYVVEPDLADLAANDEQHAVVEAHSMNPMNVLRLASSLGPVKRVLLVGCEPETLGPEEGHMGLSPAIESVVGDAIELIEELVDNIINGDGSLTES